MTAKAFGDSQQVKFLHLSYGMCRYPLPHFTFIVILGPQMMSPNRFGDLLNFPSDPV